MKKHDISIFSIVEQTATLIILALGAFVAQTCLDTSALLLITTTIGAFDLHLGLEAKVNILIV